MKKTPTFFSLIGITLFMGCSQPDTTEEPLEMVPFTQVHLTDKFWAPKIEINRTVSIPSAFKRSEETGRMDNFAVAGKLIKKGHQGDFPFDDTDVYKILEGASYSLSVHSDAKLESYLDSLIFLIGIAQEDDGYLCTCVTNQCERLKPWYGKGRWDRLNSHELYNCGHLYEAAVAHYQATGKRTLLDIAIKNANYVNEVFGPGENQKKVPSGHPIIEMALVKLYKVTNDEKYLKLARFFIDETGKGTDGHKLSEYSQDHMPIRHQEEAVGHAVRLGYLYSGVTDVGSLMHDDSLIRASKKVWENVVSKKLYITGGIGARAQGEGFGPNYELSNMTGYCETCASIANVYWNSRLFQHDADAKYFDVLERTLYNGVISGVSLSGDLFFYDNPLESEHNHDRAPWFGCACCPGNITRFMASVSGYVYAIGSNAIYVNLFATSDAKIDVSGNNIALVQKTDYPWDGNIKLKVNPEQEAKFEMAIRIPGWVQNQAVPSGLYHFLNPANENYTIRVNGKTVKYKLINGYATLEKSWKAGDEIEINFPMEVQKVVASDSVLNNRNKMAFQRGPVVYCFEDKDNQNESVFDKCVDTQVIVTANYNEQLLGGIVTLQMNGHKQVAEQKTEDFTLTAIPYYVWNNRGTASMKIWTPYSVEATTLKEENPLLKKAQMQASTGWVSGLQDGFDPKNSSDVDKSYFYWWLREGTEEWIEYRFDEIVEISQASVYWVKMNHYDVNYDAPEHWKLMYQNTKNEWVPVDNNNFYELQLDQYNTVNFIPVKTKAIRLYAKLKPEFSCGIHEWKIK
ncbi:MAG TPA: six-hairpin glycosidase [Marinilabiliales bacterium]|nr:MAG: six-hairpin glycosidase [Bacteroidetes bacterium GWE2_40_63]OFY22108.1 MAG: six-hairpin glycosidase [Bacteroidetes bacterium GWF2_40_13]OFZ27734.1 MAG: six-hairpin glycosidase [Bacteroidetes bacterium RIFOXYC2_FULL_40_12]HAM99769.1 six-hairpin glycosidase [Marinilabiliales bacterium]HBX85367.1 six-hairpin glycosidase [Marinilabiliales bacterium]